MNKLYPKTVTITAISAALCLSLLTGCETVVDQYGTQRQVMTPTGAAVLNTLVATGVGAGSGALLKNQPGWMNGMISSLSGSVASQLVDAVANQNAGYRGYSQPIQPVPRPVSYQNYGNYPNAQYSQPPQYPQYPQNSQYSRQYPRYPQQGYSNQQGSQIIYTRLPNGQFVPINP